MAVAMSRAQSLRITAVIILVLIWTLRWQWLNLTSDLGWYKNRVAEAATPTPTPTQAISHENSATHNDLATSTSLPHLDVPGLGQPSLNYVDLSDPDAPFVGWPLKRTCNEVEEWLPGVVFMCDNNFGGVGNVRNFILTCVRYAIEAGATGLVMPAIRKRKDNDISDIMSSDDFRPFSYLFDEAHFKQVLGENCPRMTLYDHWSDVPNVRWDKKSVLPEFETLDPREISRITDRCDFAELDHQTDRFQFRFKEYLAKPEHDKGTPPSEAHPRLMRGTDWPGVLWEWPVWRDGPEFSNTFGGIAKFNKQVMTLGKTVLARMHDFTMQHADANKKTGAAASKDGSKYLGVHLRTEADALPFWPTYEDQEKGYLGKAKELDLAVGYVASGNLTDAQKFAAAAKKGVKMTMVSKEDLLDETELEELHAMSWDQQGLVDYIVLAGAEYFMGNSRSSFSISVTKKRHLKEGIYARPYKVRPKGHGRSFIVGPMKEYYEHWLFIWDAMWP